MAIEYTITIETILLYITIVNSIWYIFYITITIFIILLFLYITIYCILLSRNLIITSDNHMLFIDTYNIVVVFSLLYYY
jgi:hypothetical protein